MAIQIEAPFPRDGCNFFLNFHLATYLRSFRRMSWLSKRQKDASGYVRKHQLSEHLDTAITELLAGKPERPLMALCLSLFDTFEEDIDKARGLDEVVIGLY